MDGRNIGGKYQLVRSNEGRRISQLLFLLGGGWPEMWRNKQHGRCTKLPNYPRNLPACLLQKLLFTFEDGNNVLHFKQPEAAETLKRTSSTSSGCGEHQFIYYAEDWRVLSRWYFGIKWTSSRSSHEKMWHRKEKLCYLYWKFASNLCSDCELPGNSLFILYSVAVGSVSWVGVWRGNRVEKWSHWLEWRVSMGRNYFIECNYAISGWFED